MKQPGFSWYWYVRESFKNLQQHCLAPPPEPPARHTTTTTRARKRPTTSFEAAFRSRVLFPFVCKPEGLRFETLVGVVANPSTEGSLLEGEFYVGFVV
jgi:hypothetical protein